MGPIVSEHNLEDRTQDCNRGPSHFGSRRQNGGVPGPGRQPLREAGRRPGSFLGAASALHGPQHPGAGDAGNRFSGRTPTAGDVDGAPRLDPLHGQVWASLPGVTGHPALLGSEQSPSSPRRGGRSLWAACPGAAPAGFGIDAPVCVNKWHPQHVPYVHSEQVQCPTPMVVNAKQDLQRIWLGLAIG